MNEASLATKIAKSQLLQDEVEAFLANGGKITNLDNQEMRNIGLSGSGKYSQRKANQLMRDFVAENILNVHKLAEATGVDVDKIRNYAYGVECLSIHEYNKTFKKKIQGILIGINHEY